LPFPRSLLSPSSSILRPPRSPLFPYTTLFRSSPPTVTAACSRCITSSSSTRRRPTVTSAAGPAPSTSSSAFFLNVTKEGEGSWRSEEHTSELQSLTNLVCRLLLEKKKKSHDLH